MTFGKVVPCMFLNIDMLCLTVSCSNGRISKICFYLTKPAFQCRQHDLGLAGRCGECERLVEIKLARGSFLLAL